MPRKPSLESLRATLQRLNLQQKQEIYAWLGEAIASEAEAALVIPLRPGAVIAEQQRYQGKTYQREKRRCNRKSKQSEEAFSISGLMSGIVNTIEKIC